MPRFALLRHESPRGLHWDLLLEVGPALRTWALPQPPQVGVELSCQALPDHRLAYLQYEGPLSEERGSVIRWDEGTYEAESEDETQWVVRLEGRWLVGPATLRRVPEGPDQWRFLLTGAT